MKSERQLRQIFIFIFVFTILNTLSVFAGPSRTTYQAKIVKPDGYPLEASSVNFKFTILDPAGTCILYSETYSSVNMSSTGGLISFALGSGVKTYPASATTFEQVFSNITPSLSCDTGGPTDYTPAASDIRKIVMQFHDGSGWQTLPAMSINAVPYAMYANEATKLNGLTSSDFVQLSTVPTCTASEALRYTGAGFLCVAVGNSVTSGTVVTALGYTPADGASLTTVTSDLSTVSSTVAGVSAYALSVSTTVFSVSSTVTSLQNSVAASFAAITSSQWTTSGTNIFYNTGNIGIGTTTPVTALDVSGGVRIGAESTTCAPALAGTLRYNASNVEYCNGTSWQAFGVSGSGITNFNGSTSGTQSFATGTGGTAPNFNTSNGVHTFNIPLASTGSVTAGLLSNADYATFANKITSSAASIAQVLGYVPADNAASGTYVQKANNLSDLTNIATARTNLGLGTFATASSIDLGSASATGTLAIARLPSFTGDATIAAASNTIILSNSGVTAGTYTKVTVDAKGRVTSSSALASSDVTTALGYTPANSATTVSSQWSTSGTTINYMNGNVGVGTVNPAAKLVVSGSALVGSASMNYSGSGNAVVLSGGAPIIFDAGASSLSRLAWSGGNFSFGKCQDTTCGPMSPYLEINTTTNMTTFYNTNSVRAGNGYGSATAPTFSFGLNTDIGMFNPSSGILAFATSGTERIRLTSVGTIGIGTTTPVTKLDVSGGVRISMESATCTASFAGTLRYNTTNVEYCNGTSWQAFGVSGSGITNFNGSTSGTQSFATGTGGTAPAFNTSNGVHTLNLPLASTGSVTAGLISNADYTTFTNKITSSAASIAQVLGYVPADNAASGTYAQKANNLSDLTNIATARTNLGLGTFATASSIDLGSASATGTLAIARLPSFTGDATIAAASNTIVLSNSGVTAGTYTKVTVDGKGRVTSSSALASSDVTTALGYTPANSATITSSQWNTSGATINYMTGHVGIGTSAPTSPLDVAETDTSSGVILTNTNSTVSRYPVIGVVNYAGGTTGHPVLSMSNALGTSDAPAAINSGMNLGTLLWSGRVTTSQTMQGARIDAVAEANFGVNTAPTRLTFSVAPSSGNYVQRMVINSTGNVGIGITTPTAKLHLAAGTSSTAALKFTSGTLLTSAESGTMEYDGFNFYVTDSTNTRRTIATGSSAGTIDNASNINSSGNITMTPVGSVVVSSTATSTNSSTGALVVKGGLGVAENLNVAGTISGSAKVLATGFRANQGSPDSNDSSTNGYAFGADGDTGIFSPGAGAANGVLAFYGNNTEVMRLTNGKVGIGTTSPQAKLDVTGNIGTTTGVFYNSTSGDAAQTILSSDTTAGTATANVVVWGASHATYAGDVHITNRASGATRFYNYNGTSWTETVRITSGGNVGIGTISPSYPLDVKNQMRVGAQGGSDVTLIAGGSGYGSQIYQYYADGVLKNVFSANGNSYITAGSFGIGTSAPTNVFHVKAPSTYATQTSQFAVGDSATDMKLNVGVGTDGTNKVSWVQSTEVAVSNDRNLALQPFGGKVGIGTTNPANPFQTSLSSGAGTPYVGINQTGDNPYIELQRWTGTASNYEGVRLKNIVGSGGQFAIETTQNGGAAIGSQTFTERLRIVGDSVGIGTSSPSAQLDISAGAAVGNVKAGYNGPTYGMFVDTSNAYSGSWAREFALGYGGSKLGSYGALAASGTLNYLYLNANQGGASSGHISPSMVITPAGNVGIGTTAPDKQLTMHSTGVDNYIHLTSSLTGTTSLDGVMIGTGSSGDAAFYNRESTNMLFLTSNTERVRIDASGNVGIGTTSPGGRLHIADYTTAGGKNLLLGDDSFLTDVDVSNTLGIYGNQDSTQGHIRLGSSGPLISGYTGFVGIGNATPSYTLDVSGDLRITGTPYRNGGDIAWTVPSDARLKDVLRTYDRGLHEIANLDMIIFKYKKDNAKQINSDKEYTGVIAQQVQEQIPEAVSVDKDGFLSLNTTPIFWAMINAIKELYNEVTGISREVAAIKAENAELKKQNEEIKAYLCSQNPSAPLCK